MLPLCSWIRSLSSLRSAASGTLAVLALGSAGAAPQPARADLVTGLTAYYPFEGDATDASGNGNHGSASGAPVYGAGYAGSAISLDGIDDVVVLPASLMRDDFTVGFQVSTTASAPPGTFWFEGLGMVDGEVCGSPPGGDVGIALIDGGRVIVGAAKSASSINDGSFHAVALRRSSADGLFELFVDGVVEASAVYITGPITGMPWIGVGNNPCDVSFNRRWFPGTIDELRFYDRRLSDAEVAELSGAIAAPILPAALRSGLAALLACAGALGYARARKTRIRSR